MAVERLELKELEECERVWVFHVARDYTLRPVRLALELSSRVSDPVDRPLNLLWEGHHPCKVGGIIW